MTNPDWLRLRNGSLKPGLTSHTLFVLLSGQPQYRLDVRPVGGGYICNITQTVNGRRSDNNAKFKQEQEAMSSGLESLREQLGW